MHSVRHAHSTDTSRNQPTGNFVANHLIYFPLLHGVETDRGVDRLHCRLGTLSISSPQLAHFVPMYRYHGPFGRVNSYYKYMQVVVEFNIQNLLPMSTI
jgi:hypothetical protein